MTEDMLDRIMAQLKAAAPELPAARVDFTVPVPPQKPEQGV